MFVDMKIAAVHTCSVPGDVKFNMQQTQKMLKHLSDKQVDFILFPELNISGYTNQIKQLRNVVNQSPYILQQLKEMSLANSASFAVGLPCEMGGDYFIAHYLFERGEIAGIHRKTHLGPTEQHLFTAANIIETFKTGNMNVGIQLCFESHFPELSYVQACKGANILAVAFASPRESSEVKMERLKRFLCARAYDNGCYLLACNLSGETSKGAQLPGLSMIIDPKGNVVADSFASDSGYCIADIDKGEIERIHKSRMGWFNKYKRTEIFQNYYNKSGPFTDVMD